MKRLLIYMTLIIALFNLMNLFATAEIVTKTFALNNDCYTCYVEAGNNLVYIDCDDEACWLTCIGGGNVECCWGCVQGCMGCIESLEIFESANGEDMFDYMHDQISIDVNTGTYTNNVIYIPTYTTYYRTINWSYNSQTDALTATLFVSYED
jgi:hypothetical protein